MSGKPRLTLGELAVRAARLAAGGPRRATAQNIEELEAWGRRLAVDPRVGAQALGARLLGVARACREERRRVAALLETEVSLCPAEAAVVAGVDEAGRGPLAGPVVAAAVVLRPGVVVPGLDDSKRIPEDLRELLYDDVVAASAGWAVGMAGPGLIERVNILQATYVAMRRALAGLGERPDYVLVDGFRIPGLEGPQRGIVGGDARCASIAAASIVAKVTRDRIMRQVARRFPAYGFERNKGYATAEHWAALREWGPCPAHRRSFLGREGGIPDE
jgi:ribonuclease HII